MFFLRMLGGISLGRANEEGVFQNPRKKNVNNRK